MSDMKWGLTRPRWDLLLCAIGIHKFDHYCASSHHGRDTMRTCYTCSSWAEFWARLPELRSPSKTGNFMVTLTRQVS